PGTPVWHASTAGHTGDKTLGLFEDTMQHALRTAHFPQHIDVQRAPSAGDVIGTAHLLDRAVDGITDQLLMPVAAGEGMVDLRDDAAFGIVAVGIYRGNRTDPASRSPGSGARMVGGRNAFSAFDERKHFSAPIQDRPNRFEQLHLPTFRRL